MKSHGSFTLVTIVSCCEHSQIKLDFVKTPATWAQEEKKSWVFLAPQRVYFLPFQPASRFLLQFLILLRKDKTPPMTLPVNFLPGNPKAVTLFRAWRGQLWIVSDRMSWDLRSWEELMDRAKNRKRKRKPKKEIKCHFYFLSQRSP